MKPKTPLTPFLSILNQHHGRADQSQGINPETFPFKQSYFGKRGVCSTRSKQPEKHSILNPEIHGRFKSASARLRKRLITKLAMNMIIMGSILLIVLHLLGKK